MDPQLLAQHLPFTNSHPTNHFKIQSQNNPEIIFHSAHWMAPAAFFHQRPSPARVSRPNFALSIYTNFVYLSLTSASRPLHSPHSARVDLSSYTRLTVDWTRVGLSTSVLMYIYVPASAHTETGGRASRREKEDKTCCEQQRGFSSPDCISTIHSYGTGNKMRKDCF